MKTQKYTVINPSDYVAHKSPGKFEGETPATEFFYNQWLNGDGEPIFTDNENSDETEGTLFLIQMDEADAFGLPNGHYFLLWESNDGFAFGEVYPTHSEAVRAFNSKI